MQKGFRRRMNYDEEINRLKQDIAALRSGGNGWNRFPPLAVLASYPKHVNLEAPLTSTSWDGDAHSTTAKTLIDLSAVFGVPDGIKSVDVFVMIRDSGSSSTDPWIILSPNDTTYSGKQFGCGGLANDTYNRTSFTVTCDENGDIYFQISASGAGTFYVYLQIWGYELP